MESTLQVPLKIQELKNLFILIIDDNPNVLNSIHEDLVVDLGFKNIHLAHDGVEAERLVKEYAFSIISCDYFLNSIQTFDGVGLLSYLVSKNEGIKKLIYTQSENQEIEEIREKCEKLNIAIIKKSENHHGLINAIDSHYFKLLGLPQHLKYGYMNEKDLLLTLSKDLIENLSNMKNLNDSIYFTDDAKPISIKDLIGHINSMSPIGKEYIGIWFSSQRKTLSYYEKLIQSNQ